MGFTEFLSQGYSIGKSARARARAVHHGIRRLLAVLYLSVCTPYSGVLVLVLVVVDRHEIIPHLMQAIILDPPIME